MTCQNRFSAMLGIYLYWATILAISAYWYGQPMNGKKESRLHLFFSGVHHIGRFVNLKFGTYKDIFDIRIEIIISSCWIRCYFSSD